MKNSIAIPAFNIGIEKQFELGVEAIEIIATSGEFAPENMNKRRIRELLEILNRKNVIVSAFYIKFDEVGFENVNDNIWKGGRTKKIIDLAKAFSVQIVTVAVGKIPEEPDNIKYRAIKNAVEDICEYAKKLNVIVSIETDLVAISIMKKFLADLATDTVGVTLNPANIAFKANENPILAVNELKDYIVCSYINNGHKIKENLSRKFFVETSLEKGSIDLDKYLKALLQINYNGFLTIKRNILENTYENLKEDIEYLKIKCASIYK